MSSSSHTKSTGRASGKGPRHASTKIGIADTGPSSSTPGPRTKRSKGTVANKEKSTKKIDIKTVDKSSQANDGVPSHMFASDNVTVSGGNFTIAQSVNHNANNGRARVFELLQKRVVPAAFHNSAQRVDPPRCHPDTRVKILQKIFDWITQSDDREEWIMWLNGAAGAGKSAIIQSIAERCIENVIAIASFFFFRSDPMRNNMTSLIATLVYQLIQAIPETMHDILTTIECNPLIFDQSQESQLQHLIVQPLLRLPENLQRLFVVFIDGLDECNNRDHQAHLINLLGDVSQRRDIPIVFLVAGRREPQIEAAFVQIQRSDILHTLPLDKSDIEQTSDDIRRFVRDKFKAITETHLRKHLLPKDWPPPSAVEEIVHKSSGQFIFASVVVKYVSSPRGNPAQHLEVVRDITLREASSLNPFAHLDALYRHIFSQVEALSDVLDVLALSLLWSITFVRIYEVTFRLTPGELEVLLADLTAIVECEPHTNPNPKMKFLHASLPDFLLDKSRSEEYHINLDEYCTKLLCMFLERPPPILDLLSPTNNLHVVSHQEYWRLSAIENLFKRAKASDRLQAACMSFNVTFHNSEMADENFYLFCGLLDSLKRLDFNDQGKAYHHVVDIFAGEYAKYWPELPDHEKLQVKTSHDLLVRIGQIRQEEL